MDLFDWADSIAAQSNDDDDNDRLTLSPVFVTGSRPGGGGTGLGIMAIVSPSVLRTDPWGGYDDPDGYSGINGWQDENRRWH